MKKIFVLRYNNWTADVWDEDQGAPSWPYVDAFEAEKRITELERELADLREKVRPVCECWNGKTGSVSSSQLDALCAAVE